MRVIVPLWVAFLVAASFAPYDLKLQLGTKGHFHLPAHFLVFVLTGIIFCWKPANLRLKILWASAGCLAALILELLESWFFGNLVEWADVAIGCLGVAVGFLIAFLFQRNKAVA